LQASSLTRRLAVGLSRPGNPFKQTRAVGSPASPDRRGLSGGRWAAAKAAAKRGIGAAWMAAES